MTTLIVCGHKFAIGIRYLNEVAEYPVETDLQRRNTGARALLGLNCRDRIFSAVTQRPKCIELCVHSHGDRRVVAELQRWTLHECRANRRSHLRTAIPLPHQLSDHPHSPEPLRGGLHLRQPRERDAECGQLAWCCTACRGFAAKTLHVAHAVERGSQRVTRSSPAHESTECIKSPVDALAVDERCEQPLT